MKRAVENAQTYITEDQLYQMHVKLKEKYINQVKLTFSISI